MPPGWRLFLAGLWEQVVIDRLHGFAGTGQGDPAGELEGAGGEALAVIAGLIADAKLEVVRRGLGVPGRGQGAAKDGAFVVHEDRFVEAVDFEFAARRILDVFQLGA